MLLEAGIPEGRLSEIRLLASQLLFSPNAVVWRGREEAVTERGVLDAVHEADCVNPLKSPRSLVQALP